MVARGALLVIVLTVGCKSSHKAPPGERPPASGDLIESWQHLVDAIDAHKGTCDDMAAAIRAFDAREGEEMRARLRAYKASGPAANDARMKPILGKMLADTQACSTHAGVRDALAVFRVQ
jgi:hypothetical protein